MNMDNIAIVRAVDKELIPFDGVLTPIKDTPYIRKDMSTPLASMWKRVCESNGSVEPIDWDRFGDEEYMIERTKKINKAAQDYVPYTSSYNSMVLFSLNGLVPDDSEKGFGNNTFSNKPCAIIDGLSEHIDQVVSLVPTDTALVNEVRLSPNAIILIEQNTYNSLSDLEKEQLSKLNCSVKLFNGSLKDAVSVTLQSSNRYTLENLTLAKEKGWILPSPTSEVTKETINKIAQERQIARALHWNIIWQQTDDMDKLESVKDERRNYMMIDAYYQQQFLLYLFSRIDVEENLKYILLNNPTSENYIEELVSEIKTHPEEYKKVVSFYNQGMEILKRNNQLPTPGQVIQSIEQNNHISIVDMINAIDEKEFDMQRESYAKQEQENIQNLRNIKAGQMESLEQSKTL